MVAQGREGLTRGAHDEVDGAEGQDGGHEARHLPVRRICEGPHEGQGIAVQPREAIAGTVDLVQEACGAGIAARVIQAWTSAVRARWHPGPSNGA